MLEPPSPPDEADRQADLDRLQVLDTEAEPRYERLVRLAQAVLGMPIALISLVDRDRQWFKARLGVPVSEAPRATSFCGHAILSDALFVVPDALADRRFYDNPHVVSGLKVRFYAGRPIHGPSGQRVGTLCVLDHVPRVFTDTQRQLLEDLAVLAEAELQRLALADAIAQLRRRQAELSGLVEAAPSMVQIVDDAGGLVYVNTQWRTALGYDEASLPPTAEALFPTDAPEQRAAWRKALVLAFASDAPVPCPPLRLRRADGGEVGVVGRLRRHRLGAQSVVICLLRDGEGQDAEVALLRQQASTDALTGLPNRRALETHLAAAVATAMARGAPLSVALLDVDHFKRVNDTYGHATGDAVLVALAACLRGALRPSDFLARLGGEELCLVLPATDLGAAVRVVERLRARVGAAPLVVQDTSPMAVEEATEVAVTVSAGVAAVRLGQEDTAAPALARADEALYAAKKAGRDRVEPAAP